MMRAPTSCLLGLVVLLSSGTSAVAKDPSPPPGPVFPNPGKTGMSREQQQALGMQAAGEVFQKMPVLPDDSPETVYVRQLGRKLVATIPAEASWPFEFHVIPQKEINAFALPGGQMFINVGTITAAKSEAELAGVMGHEMAHVYMQHSAKQAGKAQKTGMIAGVASAILGQTVGRRGGTAGLLGQLGQLGIQVGAQGLMMKYSRSDESQADAVGAVILHQSGYDPQGMVDFFKTMGAEHGGKAPAEFFSSHPNPENRQEAIQKRIASWPARQGTGDSAAFDQLRQHAGQLQTYTAQEIANGAKSGRWAQLNQRNGAALGERSSDSSFPTQAAAKAAPAGPVNLQSVTPSSSMVQEDLGPIQIQRPENWAVTPPRQRGQFVTIAPAAGVSGGAVGYGVLLNGTGAPQQRMSIDEMTAALIQNIQQSNELQQLGQPQPITVAGVEGRATRLESPSPFPGADGQPQKERDWLVTVPRNDGSMIFMIFVAPVAHFDQLKPTYDAMVASIRFKK